MLHPGWSTEDPQSDIEGFSAGMFTQLPQVGSATIGQDQLPPNKIVPDRQANQITAVLQQPLARQPRECAIFLIRL
jgi:hypothetical protein